MSALDAKKTYSIRLSDEDCALLPAADSISESVRRAIVIASERSRLDASFAELRGALTDLEARVDAALAEIGGGVDRTRRIFEIVESLHAFVDEAAARQVLLKIDRAQAFHAEHFANSTASFRQVVAIRAALEALVASGAPPGGSEGELRTAIARIDAALLREHWEEYAALADRMHETVFGPSADPAEAPPAAAE